MFHLFMTLVPAAGIKNVASLTKISSPFKISALGIELLTLLLYSITGKSHFFNLFRILGFKPSAL